MRILPQKVTYEEMQGWPAYKVNNALKCIQQL